MFGDIPQFLRCLVSVPTRFGAAIMATIRSLRGTVADRRTPPDAGLYYSDDPRVD